MDLNAVTSVARPHGREELNDFREGDAWLAGGTWLFSEPQRHVRRLVDLSRMGWTPLDLTSEGLSIAATCPVATLDTFEAPAGWTAAELIGQCCRSFLASFKIWNMATVGGNLCMSLPAGPMISLTAALDGTCVIWTPGGGERRLPVFDFVKGPLSNGLEPGEVLRSIEISAEALTRRTAFRRATLTPLGRSGVLLIGTLSREGRFDLTVTASTIRPVRLSFETAPPMEILARRLERDIPDDLYHDDVHGRPDWRRHMTFEFAEEIRREFFGGAA